MTRGSPRTLAILGATLLVGAGIGALADRAWLSHDAQVRYLRQSLDPRLRPNYQMRLSQLARLPSGPSLVMLGDSLTQWGEWPEWLGPGAANRGIGGDTSRGLRQRLQLSVPASAKTVVIMIGLNDLKDVKWRPETTVGNVSAILDELKGRRVILQSVLYTDDPVKNRKVDQINAGYARLCASGRCEWLDLNGVVAPKGRLTERESLDGGHLKGVAYEAWAKALKARL
ncbi:MAG: GDSL-type esterase/lipase family protein [Caulobacter sp.]|nr:GDSL-type esterase/lipase family protein [Caulobacter sp.]